MSSGKKNKRITLVGCMAHARLYFDQALDNDPQRARNFLGEVQQLYRLEQALREPPYHSNRGSWVNLRRRGNRTVSAIRYQPPAPPSWPGADCQEFLLGKENTTCLIVQLST